MKFHQLPRRSESEHLAQFGEPNEKNFVRLEIQSTGFGAITIAGRTTKTYVFRRDSNNGCHTLRVPLSLWQADNAALARDIMTKPGASLYKIVPIFEILLPEEIAKEDDEKTVFVEESHAEELPVIPEFSAETEEKAEAQSDHLFIDDDFDLDGEYTEEPEPQQAEQVKPSRGRKRTA